MLVASCQNCKHSVPAVLAPGDHRCSRLAGYPHISEVRSATGICGKPALLFELRDDLKDDGAPATLQCPANSSR